MNREPTDNRPTTYMHVVMALAFLTCSSCSRETPQSPSVTPAATAYTDGFEAVVLDLQNGTVKNVRSLHLVEVEEAIAAGSQAIIPNADEIQRQLSPDTAGDSKVTLSTQQLDCGNQRVRLTFHQSMRTYVYEYEVNDGRVIPIGSEYRDLRTSKAVRYTSESRMVSNAEGEASGSIVSEATSGAQ